MWWALTGHGPDFTKVKRLELELLSIIASHGEQGIAQPKLISLSGQDKRSLPKRTDELHRNGYIEKKPILAHATRTSLCTFARYVKKAPPLPPTPSISKVAKTPGPNPSDPEVWRDGMMIPDKFFDLVMGILREFRIVSHWDFRIRLVASLALYICRKC